MKVFFSYYIMSSFICSVTLLIAMAFFTLVERKFLAYVQLRKGPNKPSLVGLPLPLADALKLFSKEMVKPVMSNSSVFMLPPAVALFLALVLGNMVPTMSFIGHSDFSGMVFIVILALNVYPLFASGWVSNSKYALLGAVRAIAQVISYEVILSLCMLIFLIVYGNLSLSTGFAVESWPVFILPLMGPIWFIIMLAESNRTPFDLAEGESELVSGFNIEYSAGPFAFIFMAEYTCIIAMSMFSSVVLTSSYMGVFLSVKTLLLIMFFIWVRGSLPRMRYDSLMYLMWLYLLPVVLGMSIVYGVFFVL